MTKDPVGLRDDVVRRLEAVLELLKQAPEASCGTALWIAGEALGSILMEIWRTMR